MIKVFYQDNDFVIIEKPSGIIVHPWNECSDKTSLLHLVRDQLGKYVYPIHRLDRPVSGLMVFAFSSEAANFLKQQWELQETKKLYIGLCKGIVLKKKFIDYPLWNQKKTQKLESRTNFWPIDQNGHVTLVLFQITTGRYHQIRRHAGAMAHQLIGDTKYGKGKYNRFFREEYNLSRLFLHCCGLQIKLSGGKIHRFLSPLPKDLSLVKLKLGFDFRVNDSIFLLDSSILDAFSRRNN